MFGAARLPRAVVIGALVVGCAGEALPPSPPTAHPEPRSTSTYSVRSASSDAEDHDFDGVADGFDVCPALEEDAKGAHPWDGCPDTRDPARGAAAWAALPKQAVKRTRDRIAIREEVRFASGSATIDAASGTLLESIAVVLKDAADIDFVEIAGHADEEGSDENNRRLTQQRAVAVMRDLVGRGIAASRLRAAGYSSYCAIDPGKDEAARAKNRRVEIRILRRGGEDLERRWGGCEGAEKRGMKPLPLPKLSTEETARRRASESVRLGCATPEQAKDCSALCAKDQLDACLALSGAPDRPPRAAGAALFDTAHRACKLGGLDACPLAAKLLREGAGTKRDERRAFELLDAACERGNGASCTGIGLHLERGLAVPKDATKAAASYDDGCNLGDAAGCDALAAATWAGRGVPEDRARALATWVVACELGRVASCAALGEKYAQASGSLRARDRALAALHVACEQDPSGKPACDAITTLGEKPGEFRPVAVCAAGSYKACHEACDADPGKEACVELGVAELYGMGVRRSVERASRRFAAACKAGRAKACTLAALLLEGRGDYRGAAEAYDAACAMPDPAACVNRARLELEGLGTYRDEGAAAQALDAACEAGVGVACAHLSAIAARGLGAAADPGRAKGLVEKACARGFRLPCPEAEPAP